MTSSVTAVRWSGWQQLGHLSILTVSLILSVVIRVCQPSLSSGLKHPASECPDTLFHMSMLALVGMVPTLWVYHPWGDNNRSIKDRLVKSTHNYTNIEGDKRDDGHTGLSWYSCNRLKSFIQQWKMWQKDSACHAVTRSNMAASYSSPSKSRWTANNCKPGDQVVLNTMFSDQEHHS